MPTIVEEVFEAVKSNQLSRLCKLIDQQAELNVEDPSFCKFTPVHWAASNGFVDVLRKLIESKAKLDAKNSFGDTPMHSAAETDRSECVQILLNANVAANVENRNNAIPLDIAIEKGHFATAKVLLNTHGDQHQLCAATRNGDANEIQRLLRDAKTTASATDRCGMTPLLWAAMAGNAQATRLLVNAGVSLESRDRHHRTPLLLAVQLGSEEVARVLVDANADVDAKDGAQMTPLMWAAEKGFKTIVDMLIDNKASVDAKCDRGWTALAYAACYVKPDAMKSLIVAKADIYSKDNNNLTVFEKTDQYEWRFDARKVLVDAMAEHVRDAENVDMLISVVQEDNDATVAPAASVATDASIGDRNEEDMMPLPLAASSGVATADMFMPADVLSAAANGDVDSLERMIALNVPLDVRGVDESTPLIVAAARNQTSAVRVIADAGVDLDAVDYNGKSALMHAAEQGNADIAQCLTDAKASVVLEDTCDRTALDWAIENQHVPVVRVLCEACPAMRAAAVCAAARSPQSSLLRRLLDSNISIDVPNAQGETPLIAAAWRKALIEHKASLIARDRDDATALQVALRRGHNDTVHVLAEVLDSNRDTAVFTAVRARDLQTLKLLIDAQVPLDGRDAQGRSLLSLAATMGDLPAVRALVAAGVHVNEGMNELQASSWSPARCGDSSVGERRDTALMRAAAHGHVDIVDYLIGVKASVFVRNAAGQTALDIALDNAHHEVVQALTMLRDSKGNTALCAAARDGDTRTLKQLVDARVSVDSKNSSGHTPLMLAAANGKGEAVGILLEAQAQLDLVDAERNTALILATTRGHDGVIEQLVSAGASTTVRNSYSRTALEIAIDTESPRMVSLLHDLDPNGSHAAVCRAANARDETMMTLLLCANVSLDVRNDRGESPLIVLAAKGYTTGVETLLAAKAHIHAQDHRGMTALQHALYRGDRAAAQLLANTYDKYGGKHGETALRTAAATADIDMLNRLLDIGMSLDTRDALNRTPLMLAAHWDQFDCVKMLTEARADVGLVDGHGNTALSYAATSRGPDRAKIVRHLINAKADVSKKNNEGYTALDYATDLDHDDVCDILRPHMWHPYRY